MKHLRKFSIIVLFVILFTSASIAVLAHSGRTDSSGGHYDHSTGEYHWHHGEDDHQHYDMDSDGDLDCPYTFKGSTTTINRNNANTKIQSNFSIPKSFFKQVLQFIFFLLPLVAFFSLTGPYLVAMLLVLFNADIPQKAYYWIWILTFIVLSILLVYYVFL